MGKRLRGKNKEGTAGEEREREWAGGGGRGKWQRKCIGEGEKLEGRRSVKEGRRRGRGER